MPTYDMHMVLALLGIAIMGGLIGLDRTAVGQFMVSQPIVAAPFTGWVLGDPAAGLITGAALELIWVLDLPIGTFVPADSTISAVFATAVAALGCPGEAPLPVIGFSILLTTILAPVTMAADRMIRNWNSRLVDTAAAGQGRDAGQRLARAHLSGLAIFFLKSFMLYLVLVPAGIAAVALFQRMPDAVHRAMSLFVKVLPVLGAALIVRKLSMKQVDLFLLAGFVTAVVAGQAFHASAPVMMLLTVAAGWLGARGHAQRS
jgi:PTS system mannose-specific IIC component